MSYLKKIYLLLLIISPILAFAKSTPNDVIIDYYKGQRTMQAIDSLIRVYPSDYRFQYEKSIIFIENGDVQSAKKILDSLFLNGVKDENVYQLLINCNVQINYLKQADFVLDSALFYFPNSARILMEKGYRLMDKEELIDAADYFERGIFYDPKYSENYFPLITYYPKLNINLFPLLYGEIFINISLKDSLTQLASKEIYNILKSAISDDFSKITLTNKDFIYLPNEVDTSNYDFEIASQILMQHSLNKVKLKNKQFNLDFIYNLFNEFNSTWSKSIYYNSLKNPIYEYHNLLAKNKLLKPYIFLMYSQGNIEEFTTFMKANLDDFQKLINFMSENHIDLNPKNIISRSYRR